MLHRHIAEIALNSSGIPRHAETWLDANENGPAYFEALTVAPSRSDGLLIPKPATLQARWLEAPGSSEVILELAEHGRIIGHPVGYLADRLGPPIQDLRLELSRAGDNISARTKLIAMGDRFMRAKMDVSRTLYLNARILYHLDLKSQQECTIIFLAVAGTFEIWTTAFYEAIRSGLANTLADETFGVTGLDVATQR